MKTVKLTDARSRVRKTRGMGESMYDTVLDAIYAAPEGSCVVFGIEDTPGTKTTIATLPSAVYQRHLARARREEIPRVSIYQDPGNPEQLVGVKLPPKKTLDTGEQSE